MSKFLNAKFLFIQLFSSYFSQNIHHGSWSELTVIHSPQGREKWESDCSDHRSPHWSCWFLIRGSGFWRSGCWRGHEVWVWCDDFSTVYCGNFSLKIEVHYNFQINSLNITQQTWDETPNILTHFVHYRGTNPLIVSSWFWLIFYHVPNKLRTHHKAKKNITANVF